MNERVLALLYVGTGGFLGTLLRYVISISSDFKLFNVLPSGTFLVNTIGSFLIGIVICLSERLKMNESLRLFLTAGFCGGFTTFSAFSAEVFSLLKNQFTIQAFIYIAGSILLSIITLILGFIITKACI
jgi:CrcB protein